MKLIQPKLEIYLDVHILDIWWPLCLDYSLYHYLPYTWPILGLCYANAWSIFVQCLAWNYILAILEWIHIHSCYIGHVYNISKWCKCSFLVWANSILSKLICSTLKEQQEKRDAENVHNLVQSFSYIRIKNLHKNIVLHSVLGSNMTLNIYNTNKISIFTSQNV